MHFPKWKKEDLIWSKEDSSYVLCDFVLHNTLKKYS